MEKLISVIVPIYNVERYLNRCIESIVSQTYRNLEIILVDDGSPDNCPEICDEWKEKDNRIVVIHKKNGGLSSARNEAIKIAKGEYYLLVDSDDYILEDAVEVLVSRSNDADIIVGEATIHEPYGIVHRVHTNLKENVIYTGAEISCEAIQRGEWFAAACYNMYRRDFILSNDLFFKEGILHEDIEYAPRLFYVAKKVVYVHYEFYQYMIRENSICSIKSEKHLVDLLSTYAEWKIFNDNILDKNVQKIYNGALSKYYISTCRQYKITKHVHPEGIDDIFLIKNALNLRERIKTLCFVFARPIYVKL